MPWLKERAANEQEFRHEAYSRKLDFAEKSTSYEFKLNMTGLIFAFFLMLAGLGVSAYLIYKGCILTGTIFSGLTLALIAATFITRKMPKADIPKK